MTSLLSSQRFLRISLAGGLALGLATLAGCGVGTMAGPSPSGPMPLANISGTVHGGQQPISLATIQLWAVGSSGYGTDGTNLLGSHVVTTDPTGSFSITGDYTCPTNDTLVYITATAGNPGLASGTNNTAIKLVAALGPCGPLATNTNTFISINEVTTAATAVALGQYFSTTFGSGGSDNFGTANTAQAKVGLANAFATVNNLVDNSTGLAKTSVTLTGAGGTITATPESAKLYTIANILAACVNSDGSGTSQCQTTLFPDVTPPLSTEASDTLQAAVYMSLNPTSNNSNGSATNIAALYNSQSAQAPFAGGTQPTDWTIGINYAVASGTLMSKPQNIAVDGNGNVWVLSNNSGAADLAELSPTGTPLADPQTLTAPTTSPAQPQPTIVFAGTASNPRNMAIDTNNNVWLTTSSSATDANGDKSNGTVYEYMTSGASAAYSTAKSAYGIAIDGSNNVFVGEQSASAVYELYEFPGGDMTKPIGYPIATATPGTAGTSGTNGYIAPENLAFDPAGNLWMTGGVATSSFAVELTNIAPAATIVAACSAYPCAQTTSTTSNTYNTVTLNGGTQASGLAADTGSIFIADVTANGISNVPYATPSGNTLIGSTATFTTPHFDAVDGAGNVWVANQNGTPAGTGAGAGATPGGSVSETSSAGVILSPSSSSITFTNPGFVHAGLTSGAGIAVDPSGNVWIANNTSGTTNPKSVFEIVGAAAPAVTPIAQALNNNAVAKKP